jgi:hypothetical protein
MPDPQMQPPTPPPATGTPTMSTDDLTAVLGYITTISKGMLQAGQPQEAPAGGSEAPQAPQDGNVPTKAPEPPAEPAPAQPKPEPKPEAKVKHEDEQDKEIADIKAQLEELLQQENDKEGKNTGTASAA